MTSFIMRYLKNTFIRSLQKPLIIALIILLPVLTYFYISQTGEMTGIRVLLYTEEENEFNDKIISNLLSRDTLINFETAPSERSLYEDVASSKCECGYVFPNNLTELLSRGQKKNLVDLYLSGSTTCDNVINEIVYSELFREYSLQLLTDYLDNYDGLSEVSDEEIREIYNRHMEDGSTFAFDFQNPVSDFGSFSKKLTGNMLVGIFGILIFLSAYSGVILYGRDLKDGIFCNVTLKDRHLIALCHVLCPLSITAAVSAVSLCFAGFYTGYRQVLVFIIYFVVTLLINYLLHFLINYQMVMMIIMPIYLMGCLVLTPMFIDLSIYIPAVKYIRLIFIPNILFLT